MDTLSVFIAQIPRKTNVTALSHPLRQSQIDSCKSDKVKEEKFYVWKLLEYAVFNLFNKPLTDFNITLNKTGKWLSNGFEFSLSHSNGVVAVAISPYPVGVDVELIKKPNVNVYGKVFNDKQLIEFNRLPEDEKAEYFITKWANKESVFKSENKPIFIIDKENCNSVEVFSKKITFNELNYVLSIAGKGASNAKFTTIDFERVL